MEFNAPLPSSSNFLFQTGTQGPIFGGLEPLNSLVWKLLRRQLVPWKSRCCRTGHLFSLVESSHCCNCQVVQLVQMDSSFLDFAVFYNPRSVFFRPRMRENPLSVPINSAGKSHEFPNDFVEMVPVPCIDQVLLNQVNQGMAVKQ